MFDIGFSEILLIFGLTLVVLGPDKLPQVARTIGRWAGRARAMARQFRDQLEAETDNLKVDIDLKSPPAPSPPAPTPPAAPPPAAPPPAESPSATSPLAETPAPVSDSPPPAAAPSPPDTAPHDRRE
jgi:sec-independent protein translocase protein TatB